MHKASVQQERAVMCWSCPTVHGGPWGGKRVCEDGETVRVKVSIGGKGCPRGNHPDKAGVIQWCGLAWYGVPAPIRWAARVLHPSHRAFHWWPGCSCIKPLKDLWLQVKELVHANRRTNDDAVQPRST